MRLWMELQCDGGIDFNDNCINMTHGYPHALTGAASDGLKSMKRQARKQGWKSEHHGTRWFCPSCAAKKSMT